jgi:hypothetical protein
MTDVALNVSNDLSRIGLIPAPVQLFGCDPELDDEVAGEPRRCCFAAAPAESSNTWDGIVLFECRGAN